MYVGNKFKTKKLTILIVFIGLIMVSVITWGCGEHSKSPGHDKRPEIVIGMIPSLPYSYVDNDGDFAGIDVEIAKEAVSRMGFKPRFKMISRDRKDILLANGEIDCFWRCPSPKHENYDQIWSGPYLYTRQVVAVYNDSDIHSLKDLEGRYVAVQSDTIDARLFSHELKSPLPNVRQIVCFSYANEAFAAIRKGFVDAVAGNEAVIARMIVEGQGEFRLLDESYHSSQAGVEFMKGPHSKTAQELNAVFKEMKQDGTLARIVEKYGVNPQKAVYGSMKDE